MKITFTLDSSAIARVVGPRAEQAAYRAGQRARGYAMSGIQSSGRIDTGRMINSLQVRREPGGDALVARYTISSPLFYTVFQEFGTRAHGPVRAPFLVFTPKGGSGVVFAKWVRGVTPALFMTNAVARVSVSDFTR